MAQKKRIIKKKIPFSRKARAFLKKYEGDIRLVLIPVILAITWLILTIITQGVQTQAKQEQITLHSIAQTAIPYTYFREPITPPITAEAATIIDRDSKSILYEKNAGLKFAMASTTKLMTALVALDYFKPDTVLTAFTSHVEGVNVGLEVGDHMTFKDSLYALLLPSGNDVALMIAQNYPGGEESFVKAMNEKARELHLTNTHYADPAGLDDDGNYTTAHELAELAAIFSVNPTLSDVTATKSKIVTTLDGKKTFTLNNLNRLLGIAGVTGLKTGHTEGAGDVLITSCISQGHTYILVVMRSQDRFADTEILLSYLVQDVEVFTPQIP